MTAKLRGVLPLALVIGVPAYAWTHFALNFTFHWLTDGDLGNGLELPANFHLIVPAAYVSWGFFFAAGGDRDASSHHTWPGRRASSTSRCPGATGRSSASSPSTPLGVDDLLESKAIARPAVRVGPHCLDSSSTVAAQ